MDKDLMFPEHLTRVGKYRDEYPDKLLRHIEEGFKIREFGITVGVTLRTLEKWGKKFPDFGQALSLACEWELALLERYAESSASGAGKGNATMIKFLLANKDPERYQEKSSKDVNVKSSITLIDTGIRRPGDPDFADYCKKYNLDPSEFETIDADYREVANEKEMLDAPIGEHQVMDKSKKDGKNFL